MFVHHNEYLDQEALDTEMPWGKYKGTLMRDMLRQKDTLKYLNWLTPLNEYIKYLVIRSLRGLKEEHQAIN